ncbi:hypothetical protein CIHG_06996 [Coccidioides immitis H538.4]|uniref:Uncharacterized protein n=1 Tax=Coccidioides immitis H538.4 TaxID=396776 RepID=A0A0J8UP77_COCIT|nr:hypothetical protein CIHG_06996 [Coccidioides immitis H538.4]
MAIGKSREELENEIKGLERQLEKAMTLLNRQNEGSLQVADVNSNDFIPSMSSSHSLFLLSDSALPLGSFAYSSGILDCVEELSKFVNTPVVCQPDRPNRRNTLNRPQNSNNCLTEPKAKPPDPEDKRHLRLMNCRKTAVKKTHAKDGQKARIVSSAIRFEIVTTTGRVSSFNSHESATKERDKQN